MASWWNDFKSSALSGISLIPEGNRVAGGSPFNGVAVDMKEAEVGLFALLTTAIITDGTHDITLEEADDAAFTAPTAINDFRTGVAAAFAQLDSTGDDNAARALTFKRSKRFVRAVAVVAGTTIGGEYAVSFHGLRKSRSSDEDLS